MEFPQPISALPSPKQDGARVCHAPNFEVHTVVTSALAMSPSDSIFELKCGVQSYDWGTYTSQFMTTF
jgi:hypothetical protein